MSNGPVSAVLVPGFKPPLLEANINSLVAFLLKGAGTPESRALLENAVRDWRAFLKSQFQLSEGQIHALDSLEAVAVDRIQRSIDEAVQTGAKFEVISIPEAALPPGSTAATKLEGKIEFTETIGPDNKLQHQIKISGGISC
jgi:hypothetical protein